MTRDALSQLPRDKCQNPSLLLQHYAGHLFGAAPLLAAMAGDAHPLQHYAGHLFGAAGERNSAGTQELLRAVAATAGDGSQQNPEKIELMMLLRAVAATAGDGGLAELYRAAFDGWKNSLSGDDHLAIELKTAGRLRIGAGNDNALEFSLRLHPLYGVPIIPGSAIKGLAAHYCHEGWGAVDAGFSRGGSFHKLLFGSTEEGGVVIFHDAWITPDSLGAGAILRDIITPHHPQWQVATTAPTDFDSPIPVPCLSVSGGFRVVISWNGPATPDSEPGAARKWLELVASLVEEAIYNWGIGGKTSSGYGRMVKNETPGVVGAVPEMPRPGTAAAPHRGKRPAGTPVRLKFLGPRENGLKGFRAQEEGCQPGVLSLDDPPGALPEVGGYFDGYIKDDAKAPQYLWNKKPAQQKLAPKTNRLCGKIE
jgi:CRISPR type III-B/RAMP module RAMP protein Cmr6